MRSVALLLALAVPLTSWADEVAVEKLIDQLGSEDAAKRKDAAKKLEDLGPEATAALKKAVDSHADVEVRLRAAVVLRAIKTADYREVRSMGGGASYWLNRVVFSPDGKKAIATGGAVIWYDLETGKEVQRKLERQYARNGFALSADGKHFLTGHQHDMEVRLCETDTGKEVRSFKGHTGGVQAVALSPDGKVAVTGGDDRTLRVWEVESGKELRRIAWPAREQVRACAISPDGKSLVACPYGTGRIGTVRLYELESGKEIRAFAGHTGAVPGVAFVPDGKSFVTAGADGTVRVWDVETGKELRAMKHDGAANAVAVSPDGKQVLTAGFADKTVRLWDLASGAELHRFDAHKNAVLGVAFSADGKRALSSDADNTVRLWRLTAEKK